jgi:TonB family protein
LRFSIALLAATGVISCGENGVGARLRRRLGAGEPVELPLLLSKELPFRYPPALYLQFIQDSVTLQLRIDSLGRVVPESTRVAQHAKESAFDSAAMEGAERLVFRPARQGERRIPYTVLFPIKFRMPSGTRAPDDSAPSPPPK